MENKKGFTLVELLITMSIVIILATVAIGALNPIALIDRGRDATRKKDLNRIRTAMEEYYSDKGYYPGADLVNQMNNKANCGKNIFQPWLAKWPCDPNGQPYKVEVERDIISDNFVDKPRWFKVYTNLAYKKDVNIPTGWYDSTFYKVSGGFTPTDVNYGVSSTNVTWSEFKLSNLCDPDECFVFENETCKAAENTQCSGSNCFTIGSCDSKCQVSCCGPECL